MRRGEGNYLLHDVSPSQWRAQTRREQNKAEPRLAKNENWFKFGTPFCTNSRNITEIFFVHAAKAEKQSRERSPKMKIGSNLGCQFAQITKKCGDRRNFAKYHRNFFCTCGKFRQISPKFFLNMRQKLRNSRECRCGKSAHWAACALRSATDIALVKFYGRLDASWGGKLLTT